MKFLLRYIAVFVLFMAATCAARAQNTTNKGTEFWTAYMDHIDGAGNGGSQMSLYITSDVNTSGTIDIADGSFPTISFSVNANQVAVVPIPADAFMGNAPGTLIKGIHILSQKPVAIYAHIYAQAVSGATLLLPVNTLGKDYVSINYTQQSNSTLPGSREGPSYSVFNVIATEDNTTVQITPSAALLDGKFAKSTFTVTLAKKGDVYQGLSAYDLTGTHIQSISANGVSCKRIAVFSGSSKIFIGTCPGLVTSDNLFQQVYPTASWGKNYITVPLAGRNYDVYRVVVSNPATNITVDGVTYTANLNGYYEFKDEKPHIISADMPVQVVQYAVSQGNTLDCSANNSDLGDPEMIYLNPLEQSLDHVTLYSASEYRILTSYINVVLPAAATSSFVLDGTPYTNFKPVPGNAAYAYAQIHVGNGAHTISAAQNFNAIAYGFGDRESYGYAAGTNLANLNEYVSLEDPTNHNKAIQTYGCSGLNYNLSVTLPYQTTQIKWDFKDGTAAVTQNNPVAVTSTKNGQTLYTYTYTKEVKYTKGDYSIVATVFNPGADACGQNEDIEFDFTVVDPPPVVFTASNVCQGDATQFTYPPDPNDLGTKTYSWDFGDGSPLGTEQNPTHTYGSPGDYKVVLTVTNSSGCVSVSPLQTVSISKRPVAGFVVSSPNCAGGTITFTDQSTVVAGTTEAAWSWDFGDGQTSILQNPTHSYTAAGTYHVTLTITNNKGCSSVPLPKDIVIHSSPVTDFVAPDVCLADVTATFTDASTIDDHTESEFTYLWNFGDDAANITPGNPNTSTDKNPSHKYVVAKQYNVTLTVTSKYGCVAVKTQQFTVNGSIPKAAFTVENVNALCSASDVIFDDQSTVDFGNITKMVWYFDYNNNPTVGVTYLRSKGEIPADKKFTHNYGLFNAPLKQTYAVKLVVYSGESCINESQPQNIVINANPNVTLTAPPTICQELPAIQIQEDKHGFDGKGVFTGPGVSSTGLFNPSAAGPGAATINYVFTANNTGCTYSTTTSILVNPTPKVNAGTDAQILAGGQTRLNGSGSGNGVTYQWTPAAGLDKPTTLNPVATPTDDIVYTLTATSADGCSASSTVNVFVLKLPEIPNTFTPNNDGFNDLWYINHLDSYPGCTVEIFNRNGEKLYSSVGYSVPWDGRYKGADLPVGVYYYVINPKNGRKIMSGYVTIIR